MNNHHYTTTITTMHRDCAGCDAATDQALAMLATGARQAAATDRSANGVEHSAIAERVAR